MFIAHLPAGYVLAYGFKNKAVRTAIMVGSLFPDADLLYFFTVGGRKINHHYYWTHLPVFWLAFLLFSCLIFIKSPVKRAIAVGFSAGAFLHLALDSVTGGILWLYPFSTKAITGFKVPALYHPWVLNFVLHWTFIFEIALCLMALFLFLCGKKKEN